MNFIIAYYLNYSIYSMVMLSPADTSQFLIVTEKVTFFSTATDTSTFTWSPSASPIEFPRSREEEMVLPSLRVKSSFTSLVGRTGGFAPVLGAVPSINRLVLTPSAEVVVSKFTVVVLSGTISCLLRLKAAGMTVPLYTLLCAPCRRL